MTIFAKPEGSAAALPTLPSPPEVETKPLNQEPIDGVVAAEILPDEPADEEPPPPPRARRSRGEPRPSAERRSSASSKEKKPRPKSRGALWFSLAFGGLMLGCAIAAFFISMAPTRVATIKLDGNGHFRHDGVLQVQPFGFTEARFGFELSAAKTYILQNQSRDFDALIMVQDERGNTLAQDDDGGGFIAGNNPNDSFLRFRPPFNGKFVIVASALSRRQGGRFTLLVDEDRGQIPFNNKIGGPPPFPPQPPFVQPRMQPAPRTEQLNLDANGKGEVQSFLDGNDGFINGRRCRIYEVTLQPDRTYQIDLISRAFDSLLEVQNPQGMQAARDDDSGGNLDSRLRYRPTQAGVHRLIVGPLGGVQVGAFTLRVEAIAEPKDQPTRTVAAGAVVQIDATIGPEDGLHANRQSRLKVFPFEVKKGTYQVSATSPQFGTWIEAYDDQKGLLGRGVNQVLVRPARDGIIKIHVTPAQPNGEGPFRLTVRELSVPPPRVDVQPRQPEDVPKEKGNAPLLPALPLQFGGDGIAEAKGQLPMDPGKPGFLQQHYSIELRAGQSYELSVSTDAGRASAAVRGNDKAGSHGSHAYVTSSQKSSQRFTVPTAATYRLLVLTPSPIGAPNFTVRLRELSDGKADSKKSDP